MRILVVGTGKSGTTGLFDLIDSSGKRQFGPRFQAQFEPKTLDEAESFQPDLGVSKILLERMLKFDNLDFAKRFTRQVMIVRDPRDNVVSRLLWYIATRINRVDQPERDRIMAALRRKQDDPTSMSTLALYRAITPLTGNDAESGARRFSYIPASPMLQELGFFRLRYEDFVDGKLDEVRRYIGFPLTIGTRSEDSRPNVRRAGRHGDWRNWFLDEDYRFFVDERLLAGLGYSTARYEGSKTISFDETVGYVERLASVQRPAAPRS